jgi:hypothetical protein
MVEHWFAKSDLYRRWGDDHLQATIELSQSTKWHDLEREHHMQVHCVLCISHGKERQDLLRRDGSNRSGGNGIWRLIWNLKIPNAAKMFMWRACHNLWLTKKKKKNLLKQGIVSETCCLICGLEGESIIHILWSCLSSMDVWRACGRKFQKSSCSGFDFMLVVEGMPMKCTTQ